jgi:hypothetical protein
MYFTRIFVRLALHIFDVGDSNRMIQKEALQVYQQCMAFARHINLSLSFALFNDARLALTHC